MMHDRCDMMQGQCDTTQGQCETVQRDRCDWIPDWRRHYRTGATKSRPCGARCSADQLCGGADSEIMDNKSVMRTLIGGLLRGPGIGSR